LNTKAPTFNPASESWQEMEHTAMLFTSYKQKTFVVKPVFHQATTRVLMYLYRVQISNHTFPKYHKTGTSKIAQDL
jgi:hypothetical protein